MHPAPGCRYGLTVTRPVNRRLHLGPVECVGEAADHELAFSYYFQDPDGNHLELTTYDHETVRRWLKTKDRTHA